MRMIILVMLKMEKLIVNTRIRRPFFKTFNNFAEIAKERKENVKTQTKRLWKKRWLIRLNKLNADKITFAQWCFKTKRKRKKRWS
jgi:hypothetical protein